MAKRYFEMELGRLTTGYAIDEKKTLVRRWLLAATGPDDLSRDGVTKEVERDVEAILRRSAEQATYQAAVAAYAVPGEFTAKLTVAWEVFWQRFPTLVAEGGKTVANQYVSSFGIGLFEDVILEDGLVLTAMGGSTSAQMYEKLYDTVEAQVGGDVGKVIGQYFGLLNQYNNALKVDVRIKAPRVLTDGLAEADKVVKEMADVPQRLVELTEAMGAEVEHAVAGVALRVGQVAGDVARQLKSAGVKIESLDTLLPTLLPGVPRLDLKASTEELKKALQSAAEAIFTEAGNKLATEADAALTKLRTLGTSIENAVTGLARDAVIEFKRQFEQAENVYADALEGVKKFSTDVRAIGLPQISDKFDLKVTELGNGFTPLTDAAVSAVGRVETKIAQAAEAAAQAVLDAARRALEGARGQFNKTFGTHW